MLLGPPLRLPKKGIKCTGLKPDTIPYLRVLNLMGVALKAEWEVIFNEALDGTVDIEMRP